MNNQKYAYQNIMKIRCGSCEKKEIFFYLTWNHRVLIGDKDIMRKIKYPIAHKVIPYSKDMDKTGNDPIDVANLFYAHIQIIENANKYKHMRKYK